jgi:two-component system chemotaxis response regulator CheB
VRTTHRVIAIGASTGGTTAIREVLERLPRTTPGTVVVQHMPEQFTAAFATRLDDQCPMDVREARDGDAIVPGLVLLAPGNQHMIVRRSGARYLVGLKDGPPVHYQRPAVDVLFHSAARHCGHNCVAAILTGMGADGAAGMLALREAGAHTIAQDEATCVVYGMPRAAVEMDAVCEIAPLEQIPRRIIRCLADTAARSA